MLEIRLKMAKKRQQKGDTHRNVAKIGQNDFGDTNQNHNKKGIPSSTEYLFIGGQEQLT